MNESPFLYDVVTYPGLPQPQAHPARLAAIAWLHGVKAASPAGCRLLEVGCGDGASLLPMAMAYPRSTFIGVDLAQSAITQGESFRKRLGLANLTLSAADLTAWEPPPGDFDYILAHGFYSWVPAHVRDALLALCRDRLAPGGVVYISYNALPGCHIRRMLWEMMKFHVREIKEPAQRIEQAVSLLNFLAAGVKAPGPFGEILRTEVHSLTEAANRAVLFHDDLSEINHPVSITDFMDHARRFDLEFLGEADYFEMTADLFPEPVAKTLAALGDRDRVLREQYLDFLKARRFRQTLLCRSGAITSSTPRAEPVAGLSVTSNAEAEPGPADLSSGVAVKFRAPGGAAATFDHPLVKAAFVVLGRAFPNPLGFQELTADSASLAGLPIPPHDSTDLEHLRQTLLTGYRFGLVELLADPPRFARAAGTTPRLSPLARLQLEEGREVLTSLRPSIIRMENPISRELLGLLDGNRDRQAILNELVERTSGDRRFLAPGDEPKSKEWWREKLSGQLEPGLQMAARNALLVSE